MKQLFFSLLLLLLCAKTFAQSDSTWITYEDPQKRFTVQFPGLPEEISRTDSNIREMVYRKFYGAQRIMLGEFPKDVKNAEQLYQIIAESTRKTLPATTRAYYEHTTYKNLPAFSMRIYPDEKSARYAIVVVDKSQKFFYMLSNEGLQGDLLSEYTERFFESFTLLN